MRTRILLKLSGLIVQQPDQSSVLAKLIEQIQELSATHQFGIVIGGGNFFRGDQQGILYGLTPSYAHTVGMLATVMNALILENLLTRAGIAVAHFCALAIPTIGKPLELGALDDALERGCLVLFSGGIGNPFFTTDTTAIVRMLQMNASQIWKGTVVDGIYTKDPRVHPDAQKLDTVSYAYALQHQLGIMDQTAYALAQAHKISVRVFNITTSHALVRATKDSLFGSILE
jgi:uridylate kinase